MKRLLPVIFIACAIAAALPCEAKKRVTTRPRLERIPAIVQEDSVSGLALDSISLSGYDKPLRSRSESLFITNATGRSLVSVSIELQYFDLDGRQIHQATIERGIDLPAGATRQLTFTSWDRQMSFVFHASRRSTRSRGIPYTVAATVTSARFD